MDVSKEINSTPAPRQVEEEPLLELTPELVLKRRSQGRIIFDRFIRNRAALIGAGFLIFLFLFCFLGPLVTGHNQPDVVHPDIASQAPSLTYPFGTDDVGRDQLARAMAGGQISLFIGLASMITALVFGVGIGALAGFYGGVIDDILMRLTDIVLSIPIYLFLFVLAISFGNGSPAGIIFLIAIVSWTYAARLVRGEFLATKEREYVFAARSLGASDFRLMLAHILPNAAGPIIVNATLLIGQNIILESVLSYFGFGLHPPTSSWGNMVSDGQNVFDVAPWLVFTPGLLIFLTVLSFNLVGDGLRDALDPYMTER